MTKFVSVHPSNTPANRAHRFRIDVIMEP